MNAAMLARNTDPTTSHMAGASVEASRVTNRDRMLMTYEGNAHGLTADEAGAAADLLHTCYWKRVSELAALGYIEPSEHDAMRPGRSGRYQRVLFLTDAGRQRLAEIKAA